MKIYNNIKLTIASIFLLFLSVGCDEDFLDRAPKTELSEVTMFSTYATVKIYAWQFYEFFDTYGSSPNILSTVQDGDLIHQGAAERPYLYQNVNVPTTSEVWTSGYKNIRTINIMLDNIGDSNMAESEILHWRGIALFFRAHEYFLLLKQFGGVPWFETAISDIDPELFKPRDSRDVVAANILRDLKEAEANVYEEGDGDNTVNKDVVRALLSRFALFEGTWRKYHGLDNSEDYLTASANASSILIDKYPTLMPIYDEVYNSLDLAGKSGIILYKHFDEGILTHNNSTSNRSSNNKLDLSRKAVDMFLFKDGKSIWDTSSPYYVPSIQKDYYEEFRNRDTRLIVMTPPPYTVTQTSSTTWIHTGNAADMEFFPIVESISGGDPLRTLPDLNFGGAVSAEVPNWEGTFPLQTGSGYRLWKVYTTHTFPASSRDINDAPIFRIGEIMVNFAEAKFELGQFNQAIADATINKLRVRGEVAPFVVGTASVDPTRDPAVDTDLWEIRRERAIELFADGYRKDDLRRWKKMDYALEPQLGRWIKQTDMNKTVRIQDDAPEGYVELVGVPKPAFLDYYYLYPLPSDEMVLSSALDQNPGWE